MNDDKQELTIDRTDTDTEVTIPVLPHFPVTVQLALLGVFLIGLFSIVSGSPGALWSALTKPAPHIADSKAAVLPVLEEGTFAPYPIDADLAIGAQAAYVWDIAEQRVLYAKSPQAVLPLASITKLMTALVAYELVAEETRVTIPGTATSQQSASGLKSGEVFTAADLSTLALLASSNDAAYSLANAVGATLGDGEQVSQFVEAMNIRAEELNLKSLRFYNTTGLDLTTSEAGAYGSAEDVAMLVQYILSNYPGLLSVTTVDATRVSNEDGEYHEAENTNDYIKRIPNLLASKTGYTDLAGGNLMVAFDAGFNRPVIVTVLGSTREGRFSDVKKLVDAVLTAPAE